MLRRGQFSLTYLFLESFWIALTICFGRYLFIYAMDESSAEARVFGPLSICGLWFCTSVAVGGLLNRFWGGAAVGVALVIPNLIIFATSPW